MVQEIEKLSANNTLQPTRERLVVFCKAVPRAAEFSRVQPIRLRFQRVEVPPWELSVHPGSDNRLMGG